MISITLEKNNIPIGGIKTLWSPHQGSFETNLIRFDIRRIDLAFERHSVCPAHQLAPLSIKIANDMVISSFDQPLLENLWFSEIKAARYYTDEFLVLGTIGPLFMENGIIRLKQWQTPA